MRAYFKRHLRIAALAASVLALAPAVAARGDCFGDCDGDQRVSIADLVTAVNISLGGARLSSCAAIDRNGDKRATIDELIAAVNSAMQGCSAQTGAFVLASDFYTGSFASVGLDAPRPIEQPNARRQVYRDSVVRTHGGLVYVINRLYADNIQVIDPARGYATLRQCSTGNGTNPHDIAFVDNQKAYVTVFEKPTLLVVNPSAQSHCKDFLRGSINLASLADRDGNPDMDQMAIVGNRLYVALERLNIRTLLRTPAENAALAVIDTNTDKLVGSIPLTGKNPFSSTKGLPVRDGAIYVAEAGLFGVMDGGIERVDLDTQRAEGFFVTEQDLGGDVTDFAIVSSRLGYAVISRPGFTNALVAFDPATGKVTRKLLDVKDFTLFDIELNDRGELYVADRDRRKPGIRVFRAADGAPLTTGVLGLVLPPFEIVFLP